MELKTLALDLGSFGALQERFVSLAAGWYIDPRTGVRVFYDPNTQNFYTLSGGVYIPLGYMNPAPKQISIGPGEKLKITISYKYSGPAVSGALERYCVGVYGAFGFNETLVGENTKSLPASPHLYLIQDHIPSQFLPGSARTGTISTARYTAAHRASR